MCLGMESSLGLGQAEIPEVLAFSEKKFTQTFSVEVQTLEIQHNRLSDHGFFFGVSHTREEWMLQTALK